MGSTLHGVVRLALYLGLTVALVPVQALLVAVRSPLRDRLPRWYHGRVLRIVGMSVEYLVHLRHGLAHGLLPCHQGRLGFDVGLVQRAAGMREGFAQQAHGHRSGHFTGPPATQTIGQYGQPGMGMQSVGILIHRTHPAWVRQRLEVQGRGSRDHAPDTRSSAPRIRRDAGPHVEKIARKSAKPARVGC